VLADYPRSFLDFINQELGTNYTMDMVDSYDIYGCLGISTEVGMKLKEQVPSDRTEEVHPSV